MLRQNDAMPMMSLANVILIGLQIIVTSTTSNKSSGYLKMLIFPWRPIKDVKQNK
jgi:hypothetical protein